MNSPLPNVLKMLPLFSVLVFGALAADLQPAPTPAPVVQAAPRPANSELAAQITRELRSDPLFQPMYLSVDLYNGLAIVHGGSPSLEMIDAVNQKLRAKPGIELIYNYMTYPDQPVAGSPTSIVATFDTLRRERADGSLSSAFIIAGQTLERLRADPVLSDAEFQVDSYRDLVILHGSVSDPALAARAKSIAEHTDGVAAVLSYINVAGSVASFLSAPVDEEVGAPILSRPLIEAVPASFERIERIERIQRVDPAERCGECR